MACLEFCFESASPPAFPWQSHNGQRKRVIINSQGTQHKYELLPTEFKCNYGEIRESCWLKKKNEFKWRNLSGLFGETAQQLRWCIY